MVSQKCLEESMMARSSCATRPSWIWLQRTFLFPPVSWTFTKRRVYLSLFMARPLLQSCQPMSACMIACDAVTVKIEVVVGWCVARLCIASHRIAWWGSDHTYGSFFFSVLNTPSALNPLLSNFHNLKSTHPGPQPWGSET